MKISEVFTDLNFLKNNLKTKFSVFFKNNDTSLDDGIAILDGLFRSGFEAYNEYELNVSPEVFKSKVSWEFNNFWILHKNRLQAFMELNKETFKNAENYSITNRSNNTSNNSGNSTDADGYAGFDLNNQDGQFQKHTNTASSNSSADSSYTRINRSEAIGLLLQNINLDIENIVNYVIINYCITII